MVCDNWAYLCTYIVLYVQKKSWLGEEEHQMEKLQTLRQATSRGTNYLFIDSGFHFLSDINTQTHTNVCIYVCVISNSLDPFAFEDHC